MDNSIESPKSRTKNVFSYLGIIVSVLVIIVIVSLNNNGAIQKLLQPNSVPEDNQPVVKPSLTPLAEPPITSTVLTFQSCDVKKEGNPLIQAITPLNNNVPIIELYGNINKISLDNKTPATATIEVISPKGEQTYSFTVKQEAGLVRDNTIGKEIDLKGLTQGTTVSVSLNCFPKDSQIKVAQIAKMSK